MATKTLGPQASCLQHRFCHETPAPTASPRSSHVNYGSCSRRQMQSRIAVLAKKHHDRYPSHLCNQSPGRNLVMGQVKILKRGMKLSFDDEGFLEANACDKNDNINAETKIEKGLDLMLESKDRSGQNHNENHNAEAKIKKGLEVDSKVKDYVGSSFHVSPCPSLVPMPQFQRPIFY